MIIVTVEMHSHAHAQGHNATDNSTKKPHRLCPLTLSLCRAASLAADRAEKELVNVFGRGHRAEIMGERKQVKWREKTF